MLYGYHLWFLNASNGRRHPHKAGAYTIDIITPRDARGVDHAKWFKQSVCRLPAPSPKARSLGCGELQNALGYNLSMQGIGTVAIDGPCFEEFLRSRKESFEVSQGGLVRILLLGCTAGLISCEMT